MGFLKSLLFVIVLCAACSDAGNRTQNIPGDTSMRAIDSSKQINNTTRLPQDSTTTTVTQ